MAICRDSRTGNLAFSADVKGIGFVLALVGLFPGQACVVAWSPIFDRHFTER